METGNSLRGMILSLSAGIRTARLRINYLFAFTKRDRRVIRILLVLLAVVLGLRIGGVARPAKEWAADPHEEALLAQWGNSVRLSPERNGEIPYPDTENPVRTDSVFRGRSRYVPPAYLKKREFRVDLNRADSFDLQEIRGIGPVYARRILKHRERLGGFSRLDQLREVWGIDSLLYRKILPSVYLESPVYRKIDLNRADIRNLRNHPYLDYYQAKEIYLHRQRYGPFTHVAQLLQVNLIDSGTYRRIEPYLSIGGTDTLPS